MRTFQWLSSVVVAGFLLGANAAWAAAIRIDDISPNDTVTISANDFESGFFVNSGFGKIQQGLNSLGSITLCEAGAISFHGVWIDRGQSTPGSHTLYIVETCDPEEKLEARISDKLQFTVSTSGGNGTIDGCFSSDAENGLGRLPKGVNPADVFVENGTPVVFRAAFLSGSVVSDRACK